MLKKIKVVKHRLEFFGIFVLLVIGLCAAKLGFTSAAQNPEAEIIPEAVRFSENFDGAVPPQLPAGWTVTSTGTGAGFVTTVNAPDTAPNAVFTQSPPSTSGTDLTSPPIYVSSPQTIFKFRHKYAMEATWDGGVLEISVAGGPFQDITVFGGVFLAGGYTHFLNPSANPISNRPAWTGGTGGYITTSVQLPANVFRQFVRFKWRFGSDESFGNDGWWIDTISLETVSTGTNAQNINIPNTGTAAPYPSEIQISGMNGFVTGVVVDLGNFTHAAPADVDVLLVAPNGRSLVLMSDAGGNTAVNDVGLTFDDSAPAFLPQNGPLISNSFKPTNYEPGEEFPSPAPPGAPSASTLSAFYGSPPNGAWKLYVVDDTGSNAGFFLNGWGITLQSSAAACPFNISPEIQAFPVSGGTGSIQINIPQGCGWTAVSDSNYVNILAGASGEGSGTINFRVGPNAGGARTAAITVSNGILSHTFRVQQASGCPSSVSHSVLNFPASGGPGGVQVTAGLECTWQTSAGASWIQINSAPQTGSGTASFTVQPNVLPNPRSASVTIGTHSVTINQAGSAAMTKRFDFDGDGRADPAVYRGGTWYLLRSTAGFTAVRFGLASDKLVPADYDGDGRAELAVYRDGTWFTLNLLNNQISAGQFGLASDRPVPADYDGDGRADTAVYRDGTWFVLRSSQNTLSAVQFGLQQDKPVTADYDGDGRSDPAVFRNGVWYLLQSTQGFAATQFGLNSDIPVPADYDGDGRADLAVYRNGTWFVLGSQAGFTALQFGLAADVPVPSAFAP